jgi:TonB-dependent receptor
MSRLFLFSISFLLSTSILAQKGFLRGNITDGDFGGPMIGAAITLADQPGIGAITDFDGNFSLSLEPGTYSINISFISYATQTFTDVVIKSGEETVIDAVLSSAIEELGIVEITAEIRKNSDVALLMEMKNASNVTNAVGAKDMKKIGDSDLSGAIKRVPGVTVQGGKYVYVRGLGDRYTKTVLNGMEIPGLDPDVNSVQIDIFPTNVLENVSVSKTFTPDLFGDFTGGLVNVVTKSFPDEKSSQISLGLTYIPSMHMNQNFILYNRGGLDWAGFDDGSRGLNIPTTTTPPDPVRDLQSSNPVLTTLTEKFNPELGVKNKTAYPNGSFSFSHGNQITKESGATLGYNAVFNYSNQHVFYDNFQSNLYQKSSDKSEVDLEKNQIVTGIVGKNTVMWSGLLSGSYKKNNSSYTITLLNSQSGESSASQRINRDFNQTGAILDEDILTYSQRSLSTLMVSGKHRVSLFDIKWSNAFSYSRVYDPDFRETKIALTTGSPTLSPGDGAGIRRFYRDLHEFNESFKVDVSFPISENIKIKSGAIGSLKQRTFSVNNYIVNTIDKNRIENDPDWFLQPENIWSADVDSPTYNNGTYIQGNEEPLNQYSAFQLQYGAYGMAEHQVIENRLKLIYGLRLEQISMFYTGVGESSSGRVEYNNQKTLDELNLLPSINSTLNLTKEMNLRGAASRTVARPSFKEKSNASIFDPITKRTFVGNIDLEQTSINNFDLRYEWFISPKELFSISGFYKQFDGHIELVAFEAAPDQLKPRNSGQAEVLGAEIEIRKNIPFATDSSFLSNFFITVNGTFVQSRVDLNSVLVDNEGTTERELRQNNARDAEVIEAFRPMSGQAPYAINGSLSYDDAKRHLSISLAYNVQGEQLTIIGSGINPDVYTVPFQSLNFNAFKSFGKDFNSKLTFGIQNILDDERTLVYKSFGTSDEIYNTFRPGRGFSLKYTYNF